MWASWAGVRPAGAFRAGYRGTSFGRGVALGRSPVHLELPSDLLDGPPALRVQHVHHDPVLLTLYGSLLSGAGVTPGPWQEGPTVSSTNGKAPGLPGGPCTLRDQDSAVFVIANTAGSQGETGPQGHPR
jgi:hypothetical protein